MRIKVNEYIIVDSDICHGKPTFKGTWVMVWHVLEMLASGSSVKEIIETVPSITPEAVKHLSDTQRGTDSK